MGDFYQNGIITTLHNLSSRSTEEMEAELLQFSEVRPMSLVLPCLYSELEGPALDKIVTELAKVEYLNEIVIGLDRADEDQYKHAIQFFSRLPQNHRILWNDGPRLQAVNTLLQEQGWPPRNWEKAAMSGIASAIFWLRERHRRSRCTIVIY